MERGRDRDGSSGGAEFGRGAGRPAPARSGAGQAIVAALLALAAPDGAGAQPAYAIVGDAIPASLTGKPGDAERGRAIVAYRQVGLCLLCHSGPLPEERLQGNLAPSLAGAGSRWNEGQLRLRIVDAGHLNPQSIMPPYFRTEHLARVAPQFRGRTILSAEQIEDVVAYLLTLK